MIGSPSNSPDDGMKLVDSKTRRGGESEFIPEIYFTPRFNFRFRIEIFKQGHHCGWFLQKYKSLRAVLFSALMAVAAENSP